MPSTRVDPPPPKCWADRLTGRRLSVPRHGELGRGPSSPYAWPSYDVEKLARTLVSRISGRVLAETRFYTGIPDPAVGPSQRLWHGFWSNKLRYLRSRGIYVYRGRVNAGGQEKGVDVSLALDLLRATYEQRYDADAVWEGRRLGGLRRRREQRQRPAEAGTIY